MCSVCTGLASEDRTQEIADEAGLDKLPVASPWVMRLDADERLMPELATVVPAVTHLDGLGRDSNSQSSCQSSILATPASL
jgi:hypothetical protein